MTRRTLVFLITLALGLLVAPLAAEAQPPTHVHRIGMLTGTAGGRDHYYVELVEVFLEGMRALGYVEGQNLVILDKPCDKRTESLYDETARRIRSAAVSTIIRDVREVRD